MKEKGIGRVLCLLSPSQLEDYETPLIESYRMFFGPGNTLWNPVQDFNLIPTSDMNEHIIPFLKESEALGVPVVVHCYAGMGRTGIVLAAWLSRARGLSPSDALQAVTAAGRKPMEVVDAGRATIKELLALVGGK
jgi:atypical dual specificity phosphatase